MSVWKTCRYLDDTWQFFARFVNSNDAVGTDMLRLLERKTKGSYKHEPHVNRGVISDLIKLENLTYKQLKAPGRVKNYIAITNTLSKFREKRLVYGIEAVYRTTYLLNKQAKIGKPLAEDFENLYRDLYLYNGAVSQLTRQDVELTLNRNVNLIRDYVEPRTQKALDLIKLISKSNKSASRSKALHDTELHKIETNIFGFQCECHMFPGALMLERYDEVIILTNHDVDDIKSILAGVGTYLYSMGSYSLPNGDINQKTLSKAVEVSEYVLKRGSLMPARGLNLLVRACDVAYHLDSAQYASGVSEQAYNMQQEKWRDENLDKILDLEHYLSLCRNDDLLLRKELLSFHRCLPSPEYDYISHMDAQMEMYEKASLPAEFNPNMLNNLMVLYEYYMFIGYKAKHGMYPGVVKDEHREDPTLMRWPHAVIGGFTPETVLKIDASGEFAWKDHFEDYLDLLKDKAICPSNIDEINTAKQFREIDKLKRSQVMDMLGRNNLVNMEDLRNNMENVMWSCKVDDKSEAKKPGGRMFFLMGSEARLLGSEYEANVDNYLSGISQITIGKSREDKIRSLNHLAAPPLPSSNLDALFVSFDLSKWSPRLPVDFHVAIDTLLARLFGKPHLEKMHYALTRGTMTYIKNGILHRCDKPGRDFEGLAGKRLTLLHLCVMHYAVVNVEDIYTGRPRFQTYIDDGLLRLDKKGGWNAELVKEVMDRLDRAYRQCGFVLSLDKTYFDRVWNVYLNDEMLYSTKIPMTMKALLKLNDRCEQTAPSYLDEISFLDGRASGAYMSGGLIYPVAGMFLYQIANKYRGKSNGRIPRKVAIWHYVPVAFGGVGIRGTIHMCGSVSGITVSDQTFNMKAIVYRYPGLRDEVNKIFNTKIRPMSAIEQLRAPWSVRRTEATLVQNRMQRYVEEALQNYNSLPGLNVLVNSVRGGDSFNYMQPVAGENRVSLTLNALVYATSKASVFSNIAAKIIRGTSALSIVGIRRTMRCIYANHKNFEDVVKTW